MKIIYLGKELNSDLEHELTTDNPFGFKVSVKYTNNRYYGTDQTLNNCTEVHYLFNKKYIDEIIQNHNIDDLDKTAESFGYEVAFESDIHSTGFTRLTKYIESITIELDTTKHSDYYAK